VALTREDAQALLLLAAKQGLRLGSAPDTFLGAGLQTCRALLDEGAIGEPLAATAFMMGSGPESWHPDPAFFYKEGAGPLFDMGVYYLTALVSLLGPARRVSASARISRAERTITSKPLAGTTIKVDVPTHVSASIDFEAGPLATLVTSFDVHGSTVPRIEIYGTEGTLSVPDPNTFGGPVRVWSRGGTEWREVALRPGFAEQSRGIGVVDMVDAARTGRPHRANGELAVHVVDIMQSVYESSDRDQSMLLATTCQRPAPFLPD
jgi:predicted dehydrogenase